MLTDEPARGWGKISSTSARVARPGDRDALADCLRGAAQEKTCVTLRAGGNSYGDLITNSAGIIIDMSAFDRIVASDFENGTVTAEPGVPLGVLVDHCLAHGWVPAAVPGSPFVTVGGAIANNVHGKDCFTKGNFGDAVLSMCVMQADATLTAVSPEQNRELFEAQIGGLGLCGIVVEATLRLERVPSGFLDVELIRFDNADAMVRLFHEADAAGWDMLVAWMDAFDAAGRGVLEKGRWRSAPPGATTPPSMPPRDTGSRLRRAIGHLCRPFVGRWSFRLLNTLFFMAVPFVAKPKVKHFADFNFIVTSRIPEPPDLYPGGMIEVQVLMPMADAPGSIRSLLALCREHARESWWCGVKMHKGPERSVSFTGNGFSLSVNLPGRSIGRAGFSAFLDALVALVSETGGRVYIGKDMVLRPDHVAKLFPQADTFLAVKRRLDPTGLFESDLARRLFLK